jgi:ribosomal protein L29
MKVEEIRKLTNAELVEKVNASILELKKAKFALKSGNLAPENINKARQLKKDIARMKTVLTEMKLIAQ